MEKISRNSEHESNRLIALAHRTWYAVYGILVSPLIILPALILYFWVPTEFGIQVEEFGVIDKLAAWLFFGIVMSPTVVLWMMVVAHLTDEKLDTSSDFDRK